jgi:hypothetical protein
MLLTMRMLTMSTWQTLVRKMRWPGATALRGREMSWNSARSSTSAAPTPVRHPARLHRQDHDVEREVGSRIRYDSRR